MNKRRYGPRPATMRDRRIETAVERLQYALKDLTFVRDGEITENIPSFLGYLRKQVTQAASELYEAEWYACKADGKPTPSE